MVGGVKGPVGTGYVNAEFATPNMNVAKSRRTKIGTIDTAVLFI
jgi:hypothetical protein